MRQQALQHKILTMPHSTLLLPDRGEPKGSAVKLLTIFIFYETFGHVSVDV